jgi:hypothetical protein
MDRKGKWAAPIAACGVLFVLAAIYAVCYVWLSHPQPFTVRTLSGDKPHLNRLFTQRWLAVVFWPASRVESRTTGVETNTGMIDLGP